jgi:UDP-N-acetylglucosamine--N-acetylmuramyl-(pentapeptide) pyrophosphoryl-undecaprenol N-acetylglucosamine transferase
MQPFKVIISGGGTGGHIFPAIAIANALKQRQSDLDILFVGAKGKMEMQKVPAAGYPIIGLNISGLHRNMYDWRNLLFPFKLISSIVKSFWIVLKHKPKVVVGTGGFASGPLLFVASKMGVPALIQEQNSYPGITNKLLARSSQKICVAYQNMNRFFPQEKILLSGNPVRQDLVNPNSSMSEALEFFGAESKPTVLIVGGSLGARTINLAMSNYLSSASKADGVQFIWQTGTAFYEQAKKQFKDNTQVKVFPFISRMDLAYQLADIVISRAGASTISELCLIAKPVILIPSPNVAEDHQTKNAMALADKDAAFVIKDKDANHSLGAHINELISDEGKRTVLRENIKNLAMPNSADLIADEIFKLVNEV